MDLNSLLGQKNWGLNATTLLPHWTLRTPSLQRQPLQVSHGESTISSLCSCPLACVRWLEQVEHLGALLLVTMGCSFHRPDFNDSLHKHFVCLCVDGGQC